MSPVLARWFAKLKVLMLGQSSSLSREVAGLLFFSSASNFAATSASSFCAVPSALSM